MERGYCKEIKIGVNVCPARRDKKSRDDRCREMADSGGLTTASLRMLT